MRDDSKEWGKEKLYVSIIVSFGYLRILRILKTTICPKRPWHKSNFY
jgi:hypothetical protein